MTGVHNVATPAVNIAGAGKVTACPDAHFDFACSCTYPPPWFSSGGLHNKTHQFMQQDSLVDRRDRAERSVKDMLGLLVAMNPGEAVAFFPPGLCKLSKTSRRC